MREILFKLLDEIEPNEILNVRVKGGYSTVFLANKASILPLAIDMRRTQSPSSRIAEQLNIAYIRDELDPYINFLDKTFGKNKMKECIEYLLRLKKLA